MSDIFSGPPKLGDSTNTILLKIWFWIYALFTGKSPGGSGGATTGLATASNQATQIAAEQAITPGTTAAAVTPSDSTVLTSRAVWVGGAGDLSVRLSGATGTTVVFTAVPAGSLLPISVVRVMAATTATNINVIN